MKVVIQVVLLVLYRYSREICTRLASLSFGAVAVTFCVFVFSRFRSAPAVAAVSVTVTNTGKFDGDHVIILYGKPPAGSFTLVLYARNVMQYNIQFNTILNIVACLVSTATST